MTGREGKLVDRRIIVLLEVAEEPAGGDPRMPGADSLRAIKHPASPFTPRAEERRKVGAPLLAEIYPATAAGEVVTCSSPCAACR